MREHAYVVAAAAPAFNLRHPGCRHRRRRPAVDVSLLLTFGRVLEPTVHYRTQQLRLQDEVAEVGCVDTHVMAPDKTTAAAR